MKSGVFYSDKLPPVAQWESCIVGKNQSTSVACVPIILTDNTDCYKNK